MRESRRATVSPRDPAGRLAARGRSLPGPDGGPQAVGTIPEQTVDERDRTWFLVFPYFQGPRRELQQFRAASGDDSIAMVEVSGRCLTVAGIAPGTTTATITARDPAGREASQQFRIAVRYVNRPPVAVGTIREQVLNAGDAVELDLSPYFADPDGDELAYEVDVFFDEKARASLTGSRLSIVGLAEGQTWVRVRATDPYGEEARRRFLVTVEEFSRPPDVVGQVPEQTVGVGDTLVVDLSPFFHNPYGDVLECLAKPAKDHVTVSMSGGEATIAGASVGDTFVLVTASGSGGRVAMPVRVVRRNRAPEAVGIIPPQAVTAGRTSASVDLSSCFRDPDDDRLEYSVATSDDSVVTASVSGDDVTVHGVTAGEATVTVTARDPEGLEAQQSFAVTVWDEDGVTGNITGCKVVVGLLLVRKVQIEGTVRAHRAVRNVEVHLHAAGRSAGVCELGDMAAGEEKPFFSNKASMGSAREPRCRMSVSWREVP